MLARPACWLALLLPLCGGCYLHHAPADPGAAEEGVAALPGIPAADAPALPEVAPTAPPRECTEVRRVEVGALPVDMLFAVDDSGSMREEQAALAGQFPRMIEVLTSGDLDGDGVADFPPVGDLHLGVVSSDMGLNVSGIPNCEGLGDDGRLLGFGGPPDCDDRYPTFLAYEAAGGDDPMTVASDFACIASLGTDGCGFEQQLEAALKALWPSDDVSLPTGQTIDADALSFLGDPAGGSTQGHGSDANAGFLRHRGPLGSSLLALVVVSDEDDCSAADQHIFAPDIYLSEDDPLRDQDLNTRCFLNPKQLYPVSRYLNGLRALRAGAEFLVFFAAIVGVPEDLVDEDARAAVDFADPVARELYYQSLLDDTRMQEVIDPTRSPEQGDHLTPSCETSSGKAYPPRRFVELARGLGENAIVQSICRDDFRPAMQAILARLGETITVATCAFGTR